MNLNHKQLGEHLIIEVSKAKHLSSQVFIEETILEIINTTGATLLKMDFHHFGEGYGVTGVAILAESHISIHTWPEYGYAAVDVFMCGGADTSRALPILARRFETEHISSKIIKRGF